MIKKNNNLLWIFGAVIIVFFFINGGLDLKAPSQAVSGFTDVERGVVLPGAASPIYVNTPTIYSGDTITINLDVHSSVGDKAFLIHEEAPFDIIGLSNNIYETAIIDQIQVQDETKVYQFIASTIGVQTFTGIVAVNGGADQSIIGVTSIDVVSCSSSAESCNNIDDDCDYDVDEDLSQGCYTGPSGTEGVGICTGGNQVCSTGSWGSCSGETLPTTEICGNGIDEDCIAGDLTANSIADSNCDQIVDWTEINTGISLWLSGTYNWLDINSAIAVWLG